MIVSQDMPDDDLRLLEALLFAASEPMREVELREWLPAPAQHDLTALLVRLQARYRCGGVHLVRAGDTWAFVTAADLAPRLARLRRQERALSRAALETLAIIAYHQPVTRAEIEEVRGVQLSKGTLDALFEQGWIAPRGRRETPGRPMTWGTTDGFLLHFGLTSLDELPGVDELRASGLLDARPAIHAYLKEVDIDASDLANADPH
jgi:segregation and condensation protein B